MTNRDVVYGAIDGERDYQDSLWKDKNDPTFNNPLTIGEFLTLINVYLGKAQSEWAFESKPELNSLAVVRKIAGIAVNCMEQHGAPQREGFEK